MTETLEDEKTYTFDELSGRAKEAARDALRYNEHYLHDEWWDSVYEDAGRVAVILGIDLMRTVRRRDGAGTYEEHAIHFSGFCSQGGGACFKGSYRFNPKAVDEMKAYCSDEPLIGIATELLVMQLARKLRGLEPFSATISSSGRYSHSGSMEVEIYFEEDDEDPIDEIEAELLQLMRNFADWIYSSLEKEHDYLMSDECVDMQLEDQTFDEDGNEV